MLFQIPRPVIEKGDDPDPSGRFPLATSLPPSRFESIASGKKGGPCFAEKVGDDDDKSALNSDKSRFKLDERSACVDVEADNEHVDHRSPHIAMFNSLGRSGS